jgi:GT2 family glycosyltransferase
MLKLSVIVLTFNSVEFIKPCLDSIYNQGYPDFEVILVDNGSKDDTVFLVKESFPDIKLIENRKNLGACKARNQGIEEARGDWILTLDCDVLLEEDFFSNIINFAENSQEPIGMLQPKILKEDKKTIYSCGIYLSKLLRRFYDIGKDKIDEGQFDDQKNIFGACCAAALYRRTMLEELKGETGYFDERFFFLVEDVDLSWRAQKRGYKALFIPQALCYHTGNSSHTNPKLRQYLCFRNRHFMIAKNNGSADFIRNSISLFFYDLPRSIYLFFSNPYSLKHANLVP